MNNGAKAMLIGMPHTITVRKIFQPCPFARSELREGIFHGLGSGSKRR
jgi:hypothetical protein